MWNKFLVNKVIFIYLNSRETVLILLCKLTLIFRFVKLLNFRKWRLRGKLLIFHCFSTQCYDFSEITYSSCMKSKNFQKYRCIKNTLHKRIKEKPITLQVIKPWRFYVSFIRDSDNSFKHFELLRFFLMFWNVEFAVVELFYCICSCIPRTHVKYAPCTLQKNDIFEKSRL